MTDIDVLKAYRLQQADETLQDATSMISGNFSPRSKELIRMVKQKIEQDN